MEKNLSIKILQKVLDHLEMNPKQLSDAIGKDRPQWAYDVLNPNKKVGISKDISERICNTFPEINRSWLLTGEGEMLAGNSNLDTDILIDNVEDYMKATEKGLKLLPEVDFKFAGGQTQLVGDTGKIKRYWYLPDCNDCEAIAQVAGNSMAPAYPSGCWVVLKRQGFDPEYPNQIPFGNVFGIIVEDKQTGDYHGYIKILRRYKDINMAQRFWIARSIDMENNDDFDIDIKQVRGLWIVKQHVVADMIL